MVLLRQGSSGGTSSADEFLDAALTWFGDPDPRLGTSWDKGERLAKLVAHRRTLLVLDGLEPLQNPPGPQEGRVREPSIQALLRELAAFNTGLCVITTRTPVADIADHEHTQPFVVTWMSYPAMPVQSSSERSVLRGTRRSYKVPATSSVAIVWL